MRRRLAFAIGICVLALPAFGQGGSASLTSTVKGFLAPGLAGASAELQSDTRPDQVFKTRADSNGLFVFSALPPDEYTLRLRVLGFKALTVKSLYLLESEQRVLPPLELTISSCYNVAGLEYLRPLPPGRLPPGDRTGDIVGSVGRQGRTHPAVTGADVSLMCGRDKVCATTKTDSSGRFLFKAMAPGYYSIRINHAGFYQMDESGYTVVEGFESIYSATFVEHCFLGNCSPSPRPKKRIAICE